MEPPPSPPDAMGTMPDATAAAEPPLDPPLVRSISHGLRVGPYNSGSVIPIKPNSGVLVLPMAINPGPGAVIYRGLAAVTVGGVGLSLVFTLVLIPALLRWRLPAAHAQTENAALRDAA